MSKVMEVKVVCPDCGLKQKYHSYKTNKQLRGQRRKECNRCGRSFKVSNQEACKIPERDEDKGRKQGFFKYRKKE